MYKARRVSAVILAAGSGQRMGADENKVYLLLGGKPVILHALEAFDQHPFVDELVVVTRGEEEALMRAVTGGLRKPRRIVTGGETRQASVRKALAHVKSKIVLIHDGARPLVGAAEISACVRALGRDCAGAVLALEMGEQVAHLGKKKALEVLEPPLYAAQTPQGFYTKVLRRCHKRYGDDAAVTDDSSLLELAGYRVGIVPGDGRNIKITTPLDLVCAEAYL